MRPPPTRKHSGFDVRDLPAVAVGLLAVVVFALHFVLAPHPMLALARVTPRRASLSCAHLSERLAFEHFGSPTRLTRARCAA
jgi:hypothetical protein